MPLLLNKPINTVKEVIKRKSKSTGKSSGLKLVSKLKTANAQLAISDKIIPAPAAKAPRKKYSRAVMIKICLRLAPMVRSRTLSRIR